MTVVPELGLVVTGAPLTLRALDVVRALTAAGWSVQLIGTEPATDWLDSPACAAAGHPVRTSFRTSRGVDRQRRPDVVVACPATFNTLNKWASGISDSYALAVLNEALGAGKPAYAVPFVNESLWKHPAFAPSLELLASAGVVMIDPHSGELRPRAVAHGTGDAIAEAFDPEWITAALRPLDA